MCGAVDRSGSGPRISGSGIFETSSPSNDSQPEDNVNFKSKAQLWTVIFGSVVSLLLPTFTAAQAQPPTWSLDSGEAIKTHGSVRVVEKSPVFVFQDNFWVNLHHLLRADARRCGHGLPLELPLAILGTGERPTWESALSAYADLAKRSFIVDQILVQIDNVLAIQSEPTIKSTTPIDPAIMAALNSAAPIYRDHRLNEDHIENQRWVADHVPSIMEHAPSVKAAIGRVFGIQPPDAPILVDVVRDVGPNLAYTTDGPAGYSGHTFISPQANSDPDVALDSILHEISHTMDNQITAIIDAEAARQHVQIPSDLWHAITLYTTGELVRRELGRRRDDPSYAPNAAFFSMYAKGAWRTIFNDLEAHWLPYLDGKGTLSEALAAVVSNAPR